jgi:hypothetical protein
LVRAGDAEENACHHGGAAQRRVPDCRQSAAHVAVCFASVADDAAEFAKRSVSAPRQSSATPRSAGYTPQRLSCACYVDFAVRTTVASKYHFRENRGEGNRQRWYASAVMPCRNRP